jgi:DNA-3-methyladenine glycosylase I
LRQLADEGVIRNRTKIKAAITNAQHFLEVQEECGSFCSYPRSFLPDERPIVNQWAPPEEVPASMPLSEAINKDMKKRGFKFSGPTICYAHLQATGYINDHLIEFSFR